MLNKPHRYIAGLVRSGSLLLTALTRTTKPLLLALFVMQLVVTSFAGETIVTLVSQNDGNQGSDRYGFSYGWEASAFDSTSPTIWVGHWYDAGSANGSSRVGYLQANLSGLPPAGTITGAKLYLYVTGYDNATTPVATLTHVNSATATGDASQKLAAASVPVGASHTVNYADGTGWLAFDFTADVVNDLNEGYAYAAFQMTYFSSYRGLTFRSADYADPAFRPHLVVSDEVNVAPEFDAFLPALELAEDALATSIINLLRVVDTNTSQTLTWSVTAVPTKGSLAGFPATSSTAGNDTPIIPANLTYTPSANQFGSDTYTIQVSDGTATDSITVNITITAENDPPTAVNDSATVAEDSSATVINVVANDTSAPDGVETLTVTAVTQPANGTVTFTATNVSFTPAPNFNGTTTFTYTISDGNGGTANATVTVTVTAVNDSPTANTDALTVTEDSGATVVNVLANDSTAPDTGETLTVTAVTQPAAGGTVTLVGGVVRFTPAANFNGSASFTYTISDGNGGTANATVNVTVTAVNDPPTANDDTWTVAEDSSATAINVLANDTCAPDVAETLTITSVTQPANGTVTFTATNVSFTPAANFRGTTTFTYTISDGNGGTDSGTVTMTVTPVADTPTVTNAATNEDTQTAAGLVITKAAVDGPEVTHFKITAITNGRLYKNNGTTELVSGTFITVAEGSAGLKFTPDANENSSSDGPFTIAVQAATDASGGGLSALAATATIMVSAVNDAPTLSGGPFVLAATDENTTSSGTPVSAIRAGLTYADVDSGALWGIAITASVANGTWQYSTDGMTWNGVGSVSPGGALLLSSSTQIRYVPDGIDAEEAWLTFRAWDRTSGTASDNATRRTADATTNGGTTAYSTGTAQARMAITAVNDAPSIAGAVAGQAVNDNATVNPFSGLTISDVDSGATITASVALDTGAKGVFTAASLSASGFSTADGGLTYTHAAVTPAAMTTAIRQLVFDPTNDRAAVGSTETTTFTVAVNDGTAPDVTNATTTVISTSVNDAPTAIGLSAATINQSAAVAGAAIGTLTSTDVDHSSFTYTLVAGEGDTNNALFALDGATLKVGATPLPVGSYSVRVQTDDGATAGTFARSFAVTVIDNVGPLVLGVSVPANGTYIAGQNLDFVVTYNEPVIVTGAPYNILHVGLVDYAVYHAAGSTPTAVMFRYTVLDGRSSSGGIAMSNVLTLGDGMSIKDAAGNNAVIDLTPPALPSLAAVHVDSLAPVALNITSSTPNGAYKSGDVIAVQVVFSEAVTITGTPRLTLETGTTDQVVNYSSGSGTTTLTFNYTVQPGDMSADLDTAGTSALALNGGTIKDAATNNAHLALPAPGEFGSLAANKALVIDSVAPVVSSINRQTPSGTLTNAASVVYRVTFGEPVTGVDSSDFTLTKTGSADGAFASVAEVSGSIYDVTVNTITGDGTLRLDLKNAGTGIVDLATNAITTGYTSGQTYTIDATAPTVDAITRQTPTTLNTVATSVTWRVTFGEAVTGVDANDFAVTSLDGAATGTATSVTAVDARTYDVAATVTGQGGLRLDLKASGTGIADLGGNAIEDGGFNSGDLYIAGVANVFDTLSLLNHGSTTANAVGPHKLAQRFTTAATEPLTLTTVTAAVGWAHGAAAPVVTIHADGGGAPAAAVLTTLDNPGALESLALNVWTGNLRLTASTTYWVVFAAGTDSFEIAETAATTGGEGDWLSAADYTYRRGVEAGDGPITGALQIAIGATSVPTITSALTASGTYGTAFGGYTITATYAPTSFTATGLPAGLVLDTGTGAITGTPTQTGPFNVTLTATNAGGTSPEATLVLTIERAPITVTATSGRTKLYGAVDPVYTYTLTNGALVAGDAFTGALARTPGENVGTYAVSQGTLSAGGNYALTFVPANFTVTAAEATITLGGLAHTYDGMQKSATVAPTPAGLAVQLTYDGGTTPPTNAGDYAVIATIDETNYVGTAHGTLTIAKAPQTIAFSAVGEVQPGDSIDLSATASSGLPVGFSVLSGPATVSGATLSITGGGAIVVRASQTGDANTLAATNVDQTITSTELAQTITFGELADKLGGDEPFTLSATASSGLPVAFAVVEGPATIAGTTLTLTGDAGTVTVRASQPGDEVYAAAADVLRSFEVEADGLRVFFGDLSDGVDDAKKGDRSRQVMLAVAKVGDVAAVLPADSTSGSLLIVAPDAGINELVTFTLLDDGSFVTSVTQQAGPNVPAERTLTVRGQVSGRVLSGTIDGTGYRFSLEVEPRDGPSSAMAGLYQSGALVAETGVVYTVVGTNSSVLVLAVTPTYVAGSATELNDAGEFVLPITTEDGEGELRGVVSATDSSVRGTVVLPDHAPTEFSGILDGAARTDRLINLSSRARVGEGERLLITGFVIGGTQPIPVLVRAVGPGLTPLGVPSALENPQIRVFRAGSSIAENDNWGANSDPSALAAAMVRVGASAIADSGTDAALLITLAPGIYTAHVTAAANSAHGVALAEIYDASETPGFDHNRLVNISSRADVGTGDDILIGGFVVRGNAPKRILLRGVGPALAAQGIATPLADPVLSVFQGSNVIAQNDDWDDDPLKATENITAATTTGAFALTAGSADAAMILNLAPGIYTVHVAAKPGTAAGIALVEIYEIPE